MRRVTNERLENDVGEILFSRISLFLQKELKSTKKKKIGKVLVDAYCFRRDGKFVDGPNFFKKEGLCGDSVQ